MVGFTPGELQLTKTLYLLMELDNYIVDESFVISNDNIVSYTNNSINIQPQPGTHNYTYEVVDNLMYFL